MLFERDSQDRNVPGPQYRTGWIPIMLTSLREINSNDIPAVSDSYQAARDRIVARVDRLVTQLAGG